MGGGSDWSLMVESELRCGSETSDPARLMTGSKAIVSSRGVIASAVSSVDPEGDLKPSVASGTDEGGFLGADRSALPDPVPLPETGNGRVALERGFVMAGTRGDLIAMVDLGVSEATWSRSVEVEVFRLIDGVCGLLEPATVLETARFRTGTGSVGTASRVVALVPVERLLAAEATEDTEGDLSLALGPAADLAGSAGLTAVTVLVVVIFGSSLAAAVLFWALIAAALDFTVDPTVGRPVGTGLGGTAAGLAKVDACEVLEGCRFRIPATVDGAGLLTAEVVDGRRDLTEVVDGTGDFGRD
jgi:hypothetical protein